MASNKRFNFGPVAIASSVGNLLNPATATGGVNAGSSAQFIVLSYLLVVNQGGTARTFRLYKGATGGSAAGTEVVAQDYPVPANGQVLLPFPGGLRLDSADFLTGVASAASALTISGGGEVGVAG